MKNRFKYLRKLYFDIVCDIVILYYKDVNYMLFDIVIIISRYRIND